MRQIQVMMVEDDPVWQRGIADLIGAESGMQMVCLASTKEEALEKWAANEIDVVLMDINLTENNLDGIDTAMEIMDQGKPVNIIMLTSLDQEEVILDAFAAGVVNYVNKLHFQDIPSMIRSAFEQQSVIHSSAAEVLRKELVRLRREEQKSLLTNAEKDILKMVQQGHTQSEIEKSLFITKRTIKNHINRILKKMGVSSSKEAAEIAKKKKMIE
ncbi:response regulator [Ammoniphilus resinae]|uniref:DNA-binding NarL/FixJ family response regulator n=1 Tax=Ammoniphilus resinae TaxID=861532 RepID=A0ABS4GUU2_9BACL|nr:response regulator transcription factor [Ammoniphilus resinae]MBP1933832.1 DNA-binding NarL/FixJ family response regulator [Ammoniphilus resinae]